MTGREDPKEKVTATMVVPLSLSLFWGGFFECLLITFHDSLKSIEKLRTALPLALDWLIREGYEFKVFE